MKAVLSTQCVENYGAHDWRGDGECPQHWKMKGGNTYVFDMSIDQNLSDEFWKRIEKAVQSKDDYFEEYIIGTDVVDDIDFDESNYVDHWDAAWHAIVRDASILFTRTEMYDERRAEFQGLAGRETQYEVLPQGSVNNLGVTYILLTGERIPYSKWDAYFKSQATVA